ncbi:uncharacterized protein LOC142356487 [Convolutriloba macropyga]|uniref:uncharacterized protein LOC142356487 n=1 Tax=Convolutriloba macropyga TaxID=536237 RepID=UPI003F5257B0
MTMHDEKSEKALFGSSRKRVTDCDWNDRNYETPAEICECEVKRLDALTTTEKDEKESCCVDALRDAKRAECLDRPKNQVKVTDKCSKFATSYQKCVTNSSHRVYLTAELVLAFWALKITIDKAICCTKK